MGAAIALALSSVWARSWREDITSDGIYETDTYNAANNLMLLSWGLAIVAIIYVAICLLLTPRAATKPASSPAGER